MATAALTGIALTGAMALAPAEGAGAAAAASTAPGVTSNSITVGTISTQTGTLASNFSSLIYGEKAYFNYINAQGGVNGRKINYKYQLDDGGNPTTFNQLANTLINQDHVFAVTGVATAFFSPNLFVESGIPTYGYNVTGNWTPQPNLFAAGGSVEYYPAGAPEDAYVARKTQKKPSIAFVAYDVAASAAACQSEENALQAAGLHHQLLRPEGGLPGLDRGHGRPAHEAGRLQHGHQLHGRSGQRQHGQGDPAVRAEDDPAVVQRKRSVDPQHEREPDAERLFRHRPRPVLGAAVALPGSQAVYHRDEEVRARHTSTTRSPSKAGSRRRCSSRESRWPATT